MHSRSSRCHRRIHSGSLDEEPLDDFAGRIAGQGGNEVDFVRDFECGEVLRAVLADVGLGRLAVVLEDDDGADEFAERAAGHGDDGGLADGGVLAEDVFDLDGVDVLAGDDDHLVLAALEVDEAVGVDAGEVAGAEPGGFTTEARRTRRRRTLTG